MGLDLFHYKVTTRDKATNAEIINVAKFPSKFKEKFEEYLFYTDVEYVDWAATVLDLMQMPIKEFEAKFEMFMETGEGLYHFCAKDFENPWNDPGRFTITLDQCKKKKRKDPHVFAIIAGGQRGCMKPEFFAHFDHFDIVIDEAKLKTITKFCDGPECVETFIQNFILEWDETSFMMVDY